jgi:hypothetical protein
VITVFSSITFAWLSEARACVTWASADCFCARCGLDFSGFQIGGRDQLPRGQLPRSLQLRRRIVNRDNETAGVGDRAIEIRLRLLDLALVGRWIDSRQDFAFVDERIEVGVQRLNRA